MNADLERDRLRKGQDVLNNFASQIANLGTPALGPEFKNLSGTHLADALVCHRIKSKYVTPGPVKTDLHTDSIDSMLAYDTTYNEVRKKFFTAKGSVTGFLAAKAWIHTQLKGYRMSYDVQIPSGESVISSDGFVDIYHKLISQDQWSCSASCVRQAARIAYNNLLLKRVVMQRWRNRPHPGCDTTKWVNEARSLNKHIGFYVFERIFLSLVDIHSYSRITTVPKNAKERRVISCDPTWNIIVQRSIALGLLSCIRKNVGVDITQLQEVHRERISDPDCVTIDLKKASDSNWFNLFLMLFPSKVVSDVKKSRTGLFERDGDFIVANQLAPMGCGFTFEIMSITLMAYARVYDPSATVFGDDIIMNRRAAAPFIRLITNLGWVVNHEKTFVEGNFRESCGSYYDLAAKTYVKSFDFTYPEKFSDLIVCANKLSSLCLANQVSHYLRRILISTYVELLKIIPSVAFTETPLNDGEEAQMVWIPPGITMISQCERFCRKDEQYNVDYQRTVVYGKRLTYSQDVDIGVVRDNVPLVLYAKYLRNGVSPVYRKRGQFKWMSYMSF